MGRDAGNADVRRVLLKHLPHHFLAQVIAGQSVSAVHGAEYVALSYAGGGRPGIDCDLHPRRHRCGTDAAMFTDEIDDAPAAVPLLDMGERDRRYLRASEAA